MAQKSDTEQLGRNGRDAARGAGHQNHACSWSSLGPDRSLGAGDLAANNMLLNCCSVRLDASCCQPGLRLPGSKSSMSRKEGKELKAHDLK